MRLSECIVTDLWKPVLASIMVIIIEETLPSLMCNPDLYTLIIVIEAREHASSILRRSSTRLLLVCFSLICLCSPSVSARLSFSCLAVLRALLGFFGSSSRHDGVRSGLDKLSIPDSFTSLSPFLGLTVAAGNPFMTDALSSSASVPLSLGEDVSFRLFRLSESK